MRLEPDIRLRNPKKRQLSSFMAKELLYDYAAKTLDPYREKAIAEALQNSPELGKSLDDIIYGMTYCHHLTRISLAPEYLEKLQRTNDWKTKFRRYRNLRRWNQSYIWLLEAVGISIAILATSMIIPWPQYLKLLLEKKNPLVAISEIQRDTNFNTVPGGTPQTTAKPEPTEYSAKAELHTVNPDFTLNKLGLLLPGLGASIEHQALRPNPHGAISPYLRISTPGSQTEALFSELKSQGLLTWITPPSENDKRSVIFGMELWVVQQESPKGIAPAKDNNEE